MNARIEVLGYAELKDYLQVRNLVHDHESEYLKVHPLNSRKLEDELKKTAVLDGRPVILLTCPVLMSTAGQPGEELYHSAMVWTKGTALLESRVK